MKKNICFFLVFPLFLAALSFYLAHPSSKYAKPRSASLRELAEEICSQGEFNRAPVVDGLDSQIAFGCVLSGGLSVQLLNIQNGHMKPFPSTNRETQPFGYSANGLLLCAEESNFLGTYDRDGAAHLHYPFRLTPINAIWNGNNAFWLIFPHSINLVMITNERSYTKRLLEGTFPYASPMSTNKLAIMDASNILSVTADSREVENIFSFENTTPGPHNKYASAWLDYSPEKDAFLFCAWFNSNWRHLYRLSHVTNGWQLTQCTFDSEHTYNGRWIENGRGFAFIGDQTNHFYLGVRPADPNGNTNLFTDGHVYGYTVSHSGNKIYFIASRNSEPPMIWEYRVSDKELRYAGGGAKPFTTTKIVCPEEHWVAALDGLKVPYYLFAPPNLDKKKVHPAIIWIPPTGLQAFPTWHMFSQFFANIGVYCIALNHRGSDGYGRSFSQQNIADADKDVDAVYQEIIKNPYVDKERIYLMGSSGGCEIVNHTIIDYPGRWAGVMDTSGNPPSREAVATQQLRVFLFVGDKDKDMKPQVGEFVKWADANDIKTAVLYGKNTGHAILDTDVDKEMLLAMADFIFGK